MSGRSEELLVIERADGVEILASPGPGRVLWRARAGETLVPGSVAGLLVRGERTLELVLPGGVHGQIREVLAGLPVMPCGYGTPLAVLGAVEAAPLGHPADAEPRGADIRSPSHGTFYGCPGPGAPPYVAAGDVIERGATIGLVEVMKCFSPITYSPPPGVERAVVLELLVRDGQEVRADQVLARVRPA